MNMHDAKMQGSTQKPASTPVAGVGSMVATAETTKRTQKQPPTTKKDDRASAEKFKSANRYSRRVRGLKIGLPLIGSLFIIVFVALAVATQFIKTPIGIAAIDLTNGQVVMDQPTLSGFTASNAEYEIVAERARQDLTNPKKVLLEKIDATLKLDDGNVVSVSSNKGKYDVDGENLNLSAGVKVHMSTGYTAELDDAVIDMKSGVLSSENPVFITADIGEIRSDRLEVRDNGAFILFENKVRMIIQADKVRPQ